MRNIHRNDYYEAGLLLANPSGCFSSASVTSSYLEPRSSTLLLRVHQVKDFQAKDDDEDQDRERPSPGAIGKMGAGSLEQRLVRSNAKNRLVSAGTDAGNEASVRTGDEFGCGTEAIANKT